jgi:DNA polymerase-3 subunit gamma/tau
MSYTVLARRYRSGTFDEVIGQDHIAQTLKKAITSGRIAHAYLFCGTRGTGKTSTARILAKALNCASSDGPTTEPCGKCESCLAIARGDDIDVIEIDAASNTGVDNIREVIENAQYRPARSRFKVYIIDEVHMLSKSAFNALLKTLEEPPGHVKFILATTEPEKVLPTILSRCQRYDFRNIPTREIAAHLEQICKKEKIEADENALLMVAKAGAGSMRDSLSLLDRLLSVGERNLTADMVEQLLGLPKAQLLFDLSNAIGAGDVKATLGQVSAILQGGLSVDSFVAALIDHVRNLLILRTCGPDSTLVEVPGVAMDELVAQANRFDPIALTQDITILEELRRNIRQSQAGRALLDATLVRMALADQFASIGELLSRLDGGGTPRVARSASVAAPAAAQKKNSEPAPAAVTALSVPPPAPSPSSEATKLAPPPAPPSLDDEDEDGDDDLPRPGKVWTGPSLAELARAAVKPATPPRNDAATRSNVEAVDPSNLPAVWHAMLQLLAAKSPTVHPLLTPGKLVGIEDGQAVIRYSPQHDTFIKMLERNGKKDLVREKLTEVMGKPIGVRFEVDPNFVPDAPPQAATAAPSRPAPAPRPVSKPVAQPVVEEPPPVPAVKLTPELVETLRNEPLVKALMDNLGATIVKVE